MHFEILFKRMTSRNIFFHFKNLSWQILQNPKSYSSQSYFHRAGKDPLVYRSIGEELKQSVVNCGDRIALISVMENSQMTFEQVKQQSEILAIRLKELGLKSGECLAIWNLNTKQWFITWLAAALGGFPLVCINPGLQPMEVAYCLKKAKVKGLVTTQELGPIKFEKILDALFKDGGRKNFPELNFILMQGKDVSKEKFINYEQILTEPACDDDIEELYCELESLSPESPSSLHFTSGTTGQPKVAVLTHFNWVNLAHIYGRILRQSLQESKKYCLPIPLFHVFAMSIAATCLHFCNTLVMPSPFFKGDIVLDVIAKEGCASVCGTPAMYVDLIENQLKQPRKLDSLEMGLIGGSTCPPKIFLKSKQVLDIKDLRIGYGLSESTSGIIVHEGNEPAEEASKTVGKMIEHCEVKVINNEGETVPFGEPGEICIRGFCVMKEYFEDHKETKKVISRDGWLRTGDEATLLPDGSVTFEGRKKHIIIRGGENIFPKEIQNFLLSHESILEAQAVGVPDERMGEEICVFIRLKPGAKPVNEAEVKAFCEGKIAKYKIPKYVRIVDDFPRTATSKTQKFKLIEMFINEQKESKK